MKKSNIRCNVGYNLNATTMKLRSTYKKLDQLNQIKIKSTDQKFSQQIKTSRTEQVNTQFPSKIKFWVK